MRSKRTENQVTLGLSEFVRNLSYSYLSDEVVEWTKYVYLDFLGVLLRGSLETSSRVMHSMITGLAPSNIATMIGSGKLTAPQYAALANGTAAHSLEMDDVNNEASLHPGVVIFPTALACSDLMPVTGKQFVTAAVAGYEVMVRLGRALTPAGQYARGFHPTGTCGTFGSTATASRLLNLSTKTILSAFGIAGSQASGSMEFLSQGTWTKRMHPGWAAHNGILAALLAQEGFQGPTTIIEGPNGFLHGYSSQGDPSSILQDLGGQFQIAKTSIKSHACCRYIQGPIDCLLQLVQDHGIKSEEVVEINLGLLKAGWNLIAAPENKKKNPVSIVDAQFSMAFGAAVAVLYHRASLDEYTEEIIGRPEVKAMMKRITCNQDPDLETHFPDQWPAWAEIETADGKKFRAHIAYPKGDPENPLSWRELKEKFIFLTESIIPRDQQTTIISWVEALEMTSDIRKTATLMLS